MKNLYKKIGVIVLSGALLMGGALSGLSVSHANSIKSFNSDQLDGDIALKVLQRPHHQRNHKFRIVGYYFESGGHNYDLELMRFNSAYDFFEGIKPHNRKIYKIDFDKEYRGKIGNLIFRFIVSRWY